MRRVPSCTFPRRNEAPLHDVRHRAIAETRIHHVPVPVHRAEERPLFDVRFLDPREHCSHRTRFRMCPEWNSDLSAFLRLIRLALSDEGYEPFLSDCDIGHIK